MSYRIVCGVPKVDCCGSLKTMNALWPDKRWKLHNSHEEAFDCHARFLTKNGYKRVGQREFESPDGSILLLNKRGSFGAKVRAGKSDGKGSDRFMPKHHSGIIV
jgi:hypothetical protein